MDDHLFQLPLRHAVGLGDAQMSTQLLGAAVGDQRRAGDQTAIPRDQLGPGPNVTEQNVVGDSTSFGAKSPISFCAPEGSWFGVLSCAVVMIGFLSDRGRVACSREEDRGQDSLAAAYRR